MLRRALETRAVEAGALRQGVAALKSREAQAGASRAVQGPDREEPAGPRAIQAAQAGAPRPKQAEVGVESERVAEATAIRGLEEAVVAGGAGEAGLKAEARATIEAGAEGGEAAPGRAAARVVAVRRLQLRRRRLPTASSKRCGPE
jgi:hypothetical protein